MSINIELNSKMDLSSMLNPDEGSRVAEDASSMEVDPSNVPSPLQMKLMLPPMMAEAPEHMDMLSDPSAMALTIFERCQSNRVEKIYPESAEASPQHLVLFDHQGAEILREVVDLTPRLQNEKDQLCRRLSLAESDSLPFTDCQSSSSKRESQSPSENMVKTHPHSPTDCQNHINYRPQSQSPREHHAYIIRGEDYGSIGVDIGSPPRGRQLPHLPSMKFDDPATASRYQAPQYQLHRTHDFDTIKREKLARQERQNYHSYHRSPSSEHVHVETLQRSPHSDSSSSTLSIELSQHALIHYSDHLSLLEHANSERLRAARKRKYHRSQIPSPPSHAQPRTSSYRPNPTPYYIPNGSRNNTRSPRIPVKPRKSKGHSNKAYTLTQVDWMRYQKEDLSLSWKDIHLLFLTTFPPNDNSPPRESDQCMSSRLYRDNVIPILGVNGGPQWDEKGSLVSEPAKVRDRTTEEGKRKGVPYRLVDKYPWRVVANVGGAYNFVSERDRNIAKMIEEGFYNDPEDPHGRKPPIFLLNPNLFFHCDLGKGNADGVNSQREMARRPPRSGCETYEAGAAGCGPAAL